MLSANVGISAVAMAQSDPFKEPPRMVEEGLCEVRQSFFKKT
jgi:hypothetical protein